MRRTLTATAIALATSAGADTPVLTVYAGASPESADEVLALALPPQEVWDLRPHLERYADAIAADPAPLLGLSVVDPKERCIIELIRLVKQRSPDKRVILETPLGGERFLEELEDDPLPRIC